MRPKHNSKTNTDCTRKTHSGRISAARTAGGRNSAGLVCSYRTVELIRSDRRSLGIEIKDDLRVVARAPRRMPEREIRSFVDSREQWIRKTMDKLVRQRKRAEAQAEGEGRGSILLTAGEIEELREQARRDLTPRADTYASLMGVSYNRLSIRTQRSRWGSCSSKGNINLNCLLMLCPEEVRDYVVVHELCHLLHMNHSKAFWAEVGKNMPDYRTRRDWLRENGHGILMRLPR